MGTSLKAIRREIREAANPAKAEVLQGFFKTGPGEYGEGDRFLGVTMPELRALAKGHRELPRGEAEKLLRSEYHEERMLALLLLMERFRRGDEAERRELYDLYLGSTKYINNWDLIDVSAEHIVGAWLADRSRRPLRRLAKSKSLWERRIAILATFHFIRRGDFGETLAIAELLLGDEHDLIHKAVGWLLREVGKRDLAVEEEFLQRHYREMPRTMLRYAIERFPEARRQAYLKGEIERSSPNNLRGSAS